MTAPRAASAPLRVRDRLHAAPDGPVRVLHVGATAVYVEVAGWCVGVVGPGAAQVPCALRVTDIRTVVEVLATQPAAAYLGGGTLHVGGHPLTIGRVVGADVPPLVAGASPGSSPVTVQATPPATVAGLLGSLLTEGLIEGLTDGRVDAAAARRLLGRGEGLTPLGDDLLAGWLALHRAARVATPEVDAALDDARDRTTLLSATLLDCARHGEVLPEYAAWVGAIGTSAEPAAVTALHAVGATSGAGLHAGGLLALEHLGEAA